MIDPLHRQFDFAAIIKTNDLDLDHIAFLTNIGGLFGAAILQFGNMHQPILMDTDIHKSSKIGDVSDDAFQLHSNNEIFDGINILRKHRLLIRRAWVSSRFFELRTDVLQGLQADIIALISLQANTGNTLGIPGEEAEGVADAVAFIDGLRQADQLSAVPVGRRVVVIGGGMTAIDAAVQAKLLGAEEVTIAYRKGADAMKASIVEQEFAKIRGVSIRYWAQPGAVIVEDGQAAGVEFQPSGDSDAGEKFVIPADMVLKAIGQGSHLERAGSADSFEVASGRLVVDDERRTSCSGIWAGGDCIAGGDDLTVSAVQDGKVAANSIHRALSL